MPDDMSMQTYQPTALLRPLVKHYLVIESKGELLNRLLPDTTLVMAFRFKGQVKQLTNTSADVLPEAIISGLRKSVRFVNYIKNTGNILVVFKEAGAATFLKSPLHELFGTSIGLDNFIASSELALVQEQLEEAENNTQRIAVIEQFLLSKITDFQTDELITSAIQKIHYTQGNIKMKELTDLLFISQDAFEKRFRKIVGASPKKFSSIVRIKSVIKKRRQNQSLTNVALEAGYFDQAHFNKEFKIFTGQPPSDFFKTAPLW